MVKNKVITSVKEKKSAAPCLPALNPEKLYEEANTSRRYYLNLAISTRNIAIIQGFGVVVAASFLIRMDATEFLIWAGLLGISMNSVLCMLHWNYLRYFEDCQEFIVDLEQELFEENERHRLCYKIETKRNARVGNRFGRLFILNGAFLVMFIAMGALICLGLNSWFELNQFAGSLATEPIESML